MFSDELQRRLSHAGKKIISTCVHPGGSDSDLFKDMLRHRYYLLRLLAPFITHSNEDAAKPTLFAALSSDVVGGDYWGPQGIMDLKGPGKAERTQYSEDTEVASRLWAVSEELTGVEFVVGD
jgi:hypothetical protein